MKFNLFPLSGKYGRRPYAGPATDFANAQEDTFDKALLRAHGLAQETGESWAIYEDIGHRSVATVDPLPNCPVTFRRIWLHHLKQAELATTNDEKQIHRTMASTLEPVMRAERGDAACRCPNDSLRSRCDQRAACAAVRKLFPQD